MVTFDAPNASPLAVARMVGAALPLSQQNKCSFVSKSGFRSRCEAESRALFLSPSSHSVMMVGDDIAAAGVADTGHSRAARSRRHTSSKG